MKQFSFTGVLIMAVHYFAMAQMGVLGEDSKQLLLRNRLLWPEEKTERFLGGYRRAASFEIPNMTKPRSILSQNGFSVAYSEQHEQALWDDSADICWRLNFFEQPQTICEFH